MKIKIIQFSILMSSIALTYTASAKRPEGTPSRDVASASAVTAEAVATLDSIEKIVDRVTNIGKKIWTIIDNGKAVTDLRTDAATAVPWGTSSWAELQSWQPPQSKPYEIVIKNAVGDQLAVFKYRVVYVVGGSADGVGQYIGYATIQPAEVWVRWGFELTVSAGPQAIYNIGTKKNPVAAMNLSLHYKLNHKVGLLGPREATHSFYITGAGDFAKLE